MLDAFKILIVYVNVSICVLVDTLSHWTWNCIIGLKNVEIRPTSAAMNEELDVLSQGVSFHSTLAREIRIASDRIHLKIK